MSERRYPNESKEYRDARDLLRKDEQDLIDKVKAVAERRRNLHPGGQLKEDYVLQWARWESREECEILRAVYGQRHATALLIHVRSDILTPPQNFRSDFLEKHYLNKE